jgi:hypothetical protein
MAYTLTDIGCYVDGARGRYAVDRVVEIAEEHGMPELDGCEDAECLRCAENAHVAGDGSHTEWALCMCANEIEDDATDYMEEHYGVDGCYWGRSEQGDWGLWPTEEGE